MEAVKEAVEGVKKLAVGEKNPKAEGAAKPKKEKKEKKKGNADLELSPKPEYIDHRIKLFDEIKKQYDENVAKKPRDQIEITMPDGGVRAGQAWETAPADIARGISKSLFERTIIARVDGQLWDLERPLEKSCSLELLPFEDPEAQKIFWHSCAHVLGEACERRFGAHLAYGPFTDDGFFYDMRLPEGAPVEPADYDPLEKIMASAIKEKQKFERLDVPKEQLLQMYNYNKYKQHYINGQIPDGGSATVYRNGPFIDFCRGPHIPHAGRIKAFKIMKNSASYFLADAANDSLQRIYGASFPEKALLDEYIKNLEEAEKRNHRKIGTEQELFFFDLVSPGSPFFLPHGKIIKNALEAYIREEYWDRDYVEVESGNMFNSSLYKTSGHWGHYSKDMFKLDVEKEQWALKPMNCPGHCILFGHRDRSYRELPMRVAEFGVLHRNEASGALSGLTRVRRFVQDDSHIFCSEDQIKQEISGLFDFLHAVYSKFGFTFKLKLSTRPDEFMGKVETWDKAESMLKEALSEFVGDKWELNPGDGAFYGPKIDITISDALKRDFQCATIQLDFQNPENFNLQYVLPASADKNKAEAEEAKAESTEAPAEKASADADAGKAAPSKVLKAGNARPVMIHRAIYGSLERFIGILTEHLAGKWPFWLSPRQILVVPVSQAVNDYCVEVQKIFRKEKMHVDVDISGETMKKKIREGQLKQYNFIFVLGHEEESSRSVNIRNRDDQDSQKRGEVIKLDEALQKLKALRDSRQLENKI